MRFLTFTEQPSQKKISDETSEVPEMLPNEKSELLVPETLRLETLPVENSG